MLYLFIYLAGIIDTFRNFLEGLLFFIVPATLFLVIMGFATKVNPNEFDGPFIEQVPRFVKVVTITCCIVSFLFVCVPPKAVIYQIAGVYCGKQINQQIHIDKKLQKVSEIIDLQLDKNIKELSQNK